MSLSIGANNSINLLFISLTLQAIINAVIPTYKPAYELANYSPAYLLINSPNNLSGTY